MRWAILSFFALRAVIQFGKAMSADKGSDAAAGMFGAGIEGWTAFWLWSESGLF
jgi:hypothetical protein